MNGGPTTYSTPSHPSFLISSRISSTCYNTPYFWLSRGSLVYFLARFTCSLVRLLPWRPYLLLSNRINNRDLRSILYHLSISFVIHLIFSVTFWNFQGTIGSFLLTFGFATSIVMFLKFPRCLHISIRARLIVNRIFHLCINMYIYIKNYLFGRLLDVIISIQIALPNVKWFLLYVSSSFYFHILLFSCSFSVSLNFKERSITAVNIHL